MDERGGKKRGHEGDGRASDGYYRIPNTDRENFSPILNHTYQSISFLRIDESYKLEHS